MSKATASHKTTVASSRAEVWAALDRPETWNAVAGVERVHQEVIDDQGRLRGFRFDTVVGGRAFESVASPRDRFDERLMSWNITNLHIEGIIRVELEDEADGTGLTVEIELASTSLMSRMLFGTIADGVRRGLPRTVEALASQITGNG